MTSFTHNFDAEIIDNFYPQHWIVKKICVLAAIFEPYEY